jgi:hypothetical protein
MTRAVWKTRPEVQDFPNAGHYLRLLFSARQTERLVEALRRVSVVEHAGKDLLRASRLPLLPRDDPHILADLKKIARGKRLSPVLLVRGDGARDLPLIVADGYHRICAAYCHDYDEPVPCCLVGRPKD